MKKLKYQRQNSQNRRSDEKVNHIYETYKNTVIPHEHHIHAKVSDMEKATMCAYPQYSHTLPQINVYYDYVLNVHVSILLSKKHIISFQKQHPQYDFTFITSLRVVLLMVEFY